MVDQTARDLGATLREARERAGLTQTEVAAQSGLSASFVRMVEAGRSDISLSRLLSWISIFGLAVGDIVRPNTDDAPVQLARAEDWVPVSLGEEGIDFYLVSPRSQQALEPGMFVLAPGAVMKNPLSHDGEESLYVVSGSIALVVDGFRATLDAGGAAYFNSRLEHTISNGSDIFPAHVLSTATHPSQPAQSTEN